VNGGEPPARLWYDVAGQAGDRGAAPCFEVVGHFVYPAEGHPAGPSFRPWFQLRGGFAYAVDAHPDGACADPTFLVLGSDVYPIEVGSEPGSDAAVPRFRVCVADTG
jgi:hypothetical protein